MKFFYAVKEQEPGMIVSASENSFTSFGQNRIFFASNGKIRPTPAIEYSYMLYFNGNDGKVYNMFDTKNDTIWNEYKNAHKLYEDGITYQNNLTTLPQDKISLMKLGKLAAYYGAIDAKPLADLKSNLMQNVSGADIEVYAEPSPPEGSIVNFKVSNFVCIPTISNNKEKAVQFLDWANQKENYDLLVYGIEGVDWEAVGEDKYKALKATFLPQTLFSLVASPSNYRLDSNVTAEYEAEFRRYQNPKGLTADILAGFNFDSSNLANQLQPHYPRQTPLSRAVALPGEATQGCRDDLLRTANQAATESWMRIGSIPADKSIKSVTYLFVKGMPVIQKGVSPVIIQPLNVKVRDTGKQGRWDIGAKLKYAGFGPGTALGADRGRLVYLLKEV